MKPMLTFVFHFVIAILIVPGLALLTGPMLYSVLRHIAPSTIGPQEFYSDHLFFLVVANGLWLAYAVCDTFTSRSAVWVWIPALISVCRASRDLAVNRERPLSFQRGRALLHRTLPNTELA